MMLELWKNHKNYGKECIDDLIKTLLANQKAFGVQPLIVTLQQLLKIRKGEYPPLNLSYVYIQMSLF